MGMGKETFIKRLSRLTPNEINELIEEKGKKPKLRNPFVYIGNKLQGTEQIK